MNDNHPALPTTDTPSTSTSTTISPAGDDYSHAVVCGDCARDMFGSSLVTVYLSHVDFGTYGDVEAMVVDDAEYAWPLPMPMPWSSLAAACAYVTGEYLMQGFTPDGDWSAVYRDEDGNDREVRRRFVPTS